MLFLCYRWLSFFLWPFFVLLLGFRYVRGKEAKQRLQERFGNPQHKRPKGALIWLHAASVGEAQSALIFINGLLAQYPKLNILVTTGTLGSAAYLENRLPEGSFHQFMPLDHPLWARRFVQSWQPDFVLWMESELWPNLLYEIKARKIPAYLMNARLSARSFKRWSQFSVFAREVLSSFLMIFAQNDRCAHYFKSLGADGVIVTGDLKFNASPLPYNQDDLKALRDLTAMRTVWLYASTHKGEEELACRAHIALKAKIPDLLTIIVPRHPDRAQAILNDCSGYGLHIARRSTGGLPAENTDIYLADSFGELGLFYRLAPVSVIGRSFSDDGGGGHNPIEAVQLDSITLSGPHVQYQQDLFKQMAAHDAVQIIDAPEALPAAIADYLLDENKRIKQQKIAQDYIAQQGQALHIIMEQLKAPLQDNIQ